MTVLLVAIGAAIVLLMLGDVFQSVIVPRPTSRHWRVSAYVARHGWQAWRRLASRLPDGHRREALLAVFAPALLVTFLVLWVGGLILGFGLIFYALRADIQPHVDFANALYFAGTSLLTIGFGDITPHSHFARFMAVAAGASGFGTVAVVTTFLFSVFGSFQNREVFVVAMGARTGTPASGVELVENSARYGMLDSLPGNFRDGQRWAAQVLESHLAYPILSYFRSTHDNESWVATLGALMDAASLLIATVDEGAWGEARVMHAVGRQLCVDFTTYLGVKIEDDIGVERPEFEIARRRLASAGFKVRDSATAWIAFAELRATYAPQIDALAHHWGIPPTLWIGSRARRKHLEEPAADDALLHPNPLSE